MEMLFQWIGFLGNILTGNHHFFPLWGFPVKIFPETNPLIYIYIHIYIDASVVGKTVLVSYQRASFQMFSGLLTLGQGAESDGGAALSLLGP